MTYASPSRSACTSTLHPTLEAMRDPAVRRAPIVATCLYRASGRATLARNGRTQRRIIQAGRLAILVLAQIPLPVAHQLGG